MRADLKYLTGEQKATTTNGSWRRSILKKISRKKIKNELKTKDNQMNILDVLNLYAAAGAVLTGAVQVERFNLATFTLNEETEIVEKAHKCAQKLNQSTDTVRDLIKELSEIISDTKQKFSVVYNEQENKVKIDYVLSNGVFPVREGSRKYIYLDEDNCFSFSHNSHIVGFRGRIEKLDDLTFKCHIERAVSSYLDGFEDKNKKCECVLYIEETIVTLQE